MAQNSFPSTAVNAPQHALLNLQEASYTISFVCAFLEAAAVNFQLTQLKTNRPVLSEMAGTWKEQDSNLTLSREHEADTLYK